MLHSNFQVRNDNDNWTCVVKLDGDNIYIMHDAQTDRDQVILNSQEWIFVERAVRQLKAARNAAEVAMEIE